MQSLTSEKKKKKKKEKAPGQLLSHHKLLITASYLLQDLVSVFIYSLCPSFVSHELLYGVFGLPLYLQNNSIYFDIYACLNNPPVLTISVSEQN